MAASAIARELLYASAPDGVRKEVRRNQSPEWEGLSGERASAVKKADVTRPPSVQTEADVGARREDTLIPPRERAGHSAEV